MDSNKKLTIAVGIPTANNEDTIRETLESLLRQTVQPDRIIIIDASTDSTPNIVRSVNKNTSVPIEIHQQSTRGQGVGGARQDIYDLLEEDILACLDTQKKVGSRWIETRLQFHRGNPEYDILSGMRSTESVDRPATGPKDQISSVSRTVRYGSQLSTESRDGILGWREGKTGIYAFVFGLLARKRISKAI